jgi:hypothetical protein
MNLKNLAILGLLAVILLGSTTACKSASGSREYIPGRGWTPNN